MGNPATGELRFEVEGKPYVAVLDMAAIARFEDETDISIVEIGTQLAAPTGRPPKLSTMGSLIAAMLHRHHPEIDRTKGMELIASPEVQKVLGDAMETAMPAPEAGDENPT